MPADAPRPIRLVESHHLYVGPDDGWRLAGPGDTFERLRVPRRVGSALERLLCGRVSYSTAVSESGDQQVLDSVLAAFARRGLLRDGPPATVPPRPEPVAVLGTGRIAAQVAELLVAADQPIHTITTPGNAILDEADLGGAGAVIACAGRLTDARWQQLDVTCLDSGLPWHRCYQEGDRYIVGPFSIPGRTASYRDTRARRLAAARHPDELMASWRHLDEHCPPSPEAGPALSAVVAGILAADVLALLRHRQIPTAGHQLVIHPDTMVVDRHPVLPLPVSVIEGWAAQPGGPV